MNLIEIIMEYLTQEPHAREKYLTHIVADCGVDVTLIPHIRGLEKRAEATYNGFITTTLENAADHGQDVSLWLIKSFSP